MTQFGKFPERTAKALVAEAVELALRDAGVALGDIDIVFSSNSLAGLLTGQESVRGQSALGSFVLDGLPIVNVENACASGSTAFWLACQAIAAGQSRLALAVGFEKMAVGDTPRTVAAISTGRDLDEVEHDHPGWTFMDGYAEKIQAHMAAHGSTADDFARIAVKNRGHATLNPLAQYRDPITVDDVLASRTIAPPLTQLMCAPIGDGAAAVVLGAATGSAPRVRASKLVSDSTEGGVTAAARAAYELAGVGPEDIDVAEVHDAASPAELVAYEDLLFAAKGEGPVLVRSGATTLGGRLPVNTSGGLVSRGHPIGATGLAMIHEVVLQLRGDAGPRQVTGSQVGLVYNAGGQIRGAPAATAVHILSSS